jgi:hypothetical protein
MRQSWLLCVSLVFLTSIFGSAQPLPDIKFVLTRLAPEKILKPDLQVLLTPEVGSPNLSRQQKTSIDPILLRRE